MKRYRIALLSLMVVIYVQCSSKDYETFLQERKKLIESINSNNKSSPYWKSPDAADKIVITFMRNNEKFRDRFFKENGMR